MQTMIYLLFLTMFLASTTTGSFTMKRQLLKAGFHRDIETKLHVPRQFVKECAKSSLLLFETLSTGVYADPFHVESQERFGGPRVHFVQSVNIEAAEFVSKPLELYIFLNMSTMSLEVMKNMVETTVVLPIHARYHQVPEDPDATHASVRIPNPSLYTNCSTGGHIDKHTLSAPCDLRSPDTCTWYHLSYQSTASDITMKVPVGQAKHKPLVIIGTILLSIVVSSVLIKIIWSQPNTNINKLS